MKDIEAFGAKLIAGGLVLKSLSAGALYYGYISTLGAGLGIGIGVSMVYAGAFFLGAGFYEKPAKVNVTHHHVHHSVWVNEEKPLMALKG